MTLETSLAEAWPKMEKEILELRDTLARWERNAQRAANAAAHRQDQPVPTPEQLGEIVEGLAGREAHSDRLAMENQEIIFAWENVGLRLVPHPDKIPPTPEQATERLQELEIEVSECLKHKAAMALKGAAHSGSPTSD